MCVTSQDNINPGNIYSQFLINIKSVMRQQNNNFSPVFTGLIHILLDFIWPDTKGPAFNQMAWIGDWRIGKMLTNYSNLYAAPLKIGCAVKNTFFPFSIKTVTAQERVTHLINQLFHTVFAKGELPMPDHGIRLQRFHGCNHIRALGFQ